MTIVSVKAAAAKLGRFPPLSVKRAVLGVYGRNPGRIRSLTRQLSRIENMPFLRVGLVTVRPLNSSDGQYANLQRDVDNANDIWQAECGVWIYCTGSRVDNSGLLGMNAVLDQGSCPLGVQSSPTTEETNLFNLGRNLNANVVCYFIAGSTNPGLGGCAAHPAGLRGFWVGFNTDQNMFAHELTHVVGPNAHPADDPDIADNDQDNLMWPTPSAITNLPADLETVQENRILSDTDIGTV
jgi:hypothetical protein